MREEQQEVAERPSDNPSSTKPERPAGYVTTFGAFLMCAITATVSIGSAYWLINAHPSGAVVTVQAERLIGAKLIAMQKAKVAPERLKAEAEAFASQLQGALDRYADSGFVVIHGQAVAKAPASLDITLQLAQELGVPANEIPLDAPRIR